MRRFRGWFLRLIVLDVSTTGVVLVLLEVLVLLVVVVLVGKTVTMKGVGRVSLSGTGLAFGSLLVLLLTCSTMDTLTLSDIPFKSICPWNVMHPPVAAVVAEAAIVVLVVVLNKRCESL